jgi:two-component system sensor histidine kinase QseC
MTLRRRLLLLMLVAVPIVWAIAVGAAYLRSRHEVDEWFDTEQIRFAQLVLSMLPSSNLDPPRPLPRVQGSIGEAELEDVSVAVWSADGRLLLADEQGATLPLRAGAPGFVELDMRGARWRVYYLHPDGSPWTIAVAQNIDERAEVLTGLLTGQMLPLILMLPVLLIAMAIAVRHALKPVQAVASEIEHRRADDLRPVDTPNLPTELKPLIAAMNRLFARIGDAIEHERRLTADAAHELRTPLAALRAQWDAACVARDPVARETASRQIGAGIDRLGHLVDQLLALAAIERRSAGGFTGRVRWDRVVEQALSDCMPLIERTGSDVEVVWPQHGSALAIAGDEPLLTLMLRNLVDNALRYSPGRSRVLIRFAADRIVVEDDGPGITEAVSRRLGDRFFRPSGQQEPGSGLGVSIALRVAALHQLDVTFENRAAVVAGERGLRVSIRHAGR